jgi:hypothetical protein
MSTKIKVGTKLNLDNNEQNVTILERNGNYCFYEGVTNSKQKYWNTGNVFTNNRDGAEEFRAGIMNCSEMYARLKEEVYAIYQKNVADMQRKATADAEQAIRDKKNAEIQESIYGKSRDARKMREEAFTELNGLVCSARDLKAVLKDKRAKELVDLIAYLDTYTKFDFNPHYASGLIF